MLASHRPTALPEHALTPPGAHLDVQRMPAHWLMARLGKRVLRPGGIELTRRLLTHTAIGPEDDVVELAPGLGRTGMLILSEGPRNYVGIERDDDAARFAEDTLQRGGFPHARVLHADASATPLLDGAASVVIGEAMLSMQTAATKQAIMREAHRCLRPGGRYAIHELAVMPDSIDPAVMTRIQADLSESIHVGVRIGTVREWTAWLERAGFAIDRVTVAPMHLLEPARVIRDEGIAGAARFLFNALRTPGAPRRLRAVRRVFHTHRRRLCAVAIVAHREAPAASAHA